MKSFDQKALSSTPHKPRVAVVILNWNGYHDTVACLESLARSTERPLALIVVDNNSQEPEAQKLRARFGDRITVLANDRNLGVSGGNNTGLRFVLKQQTIEYVVMMNNDLVVEPTAIAALVAEADIDQTIGMVASRMMNYFQRNRVDNLGIALLNSGLGYNRKDTSLPLFCPCSGFALYRVSSLREILLPNGEIWDEDFFAYVDELDVGFRLRLRGYQAAYAPEAVAYHKEGVTSGGPTSDFSLFHGHRNNLWFLIKNFPLSFLARFALSILGTQLGTLLLYAWRRRFRVVFQAKWAAIRGLPCMLKKRRWVLDGKRIKTKKLLDAMAHRSYIHVPLQPREADRESSS